MTLRDLIIIKTDGNLRTDIKDILSKAVMELHRIESEESAVLPEEFTSLRIYSRSDKDYYKGLYSGSSNAKLIELFDDEKVNLVEVLTDNRDSLVLFIDLIMDMPGNKRSFYVKSISCQDKEVRDVTFKAYLEKYNAVEEDQCECIETLSSNKILIVPSDGKQSFRLYYFSVKGV